MRQVIVGDAIEQNRTLLTAKDGGPSYVILPYFTSPGGPISVSLYKIASQIPANDREALILGGRPEFIGSFLGRVESELNQLCPLEWFVIAAKRGTRTPIASSEHSRGEHCTDGEETYGTTRYTERYSDTDAECLDLGPADGTDASVFLAGFALSSTLTAVSAPLVSCEEDPPGPCTRCYYLTPIGRATVADLGGTTAMVETTTHAYELHYVTGGSSGARTVRAFNRTYDVQTSPVTSGCPGVASVESFNRTARSVALTGLATTHFPFQLAVTRFEEFETEPAVAGFEIPGPLQYGYRRPDGGSYSVDLYDGYFRCRFGGDWRNTSGSAVECFDDGGLYCLNEPNVLTHVSYVSGSRWERFRTTIDLTGPGFECGIPLGDPWALLGEPTHPPSPLFYCDAYAQASSHADLEPLLIETGGTEPPICVGTP